MATISPPIVKPYRERLDAVDALRGLAALYVLVYHVVFIPKPNLAVPGWASPFVINGGTGVTLFFVVSAFCLCLSMRLHKQEQSPTLSFYLRRVFRIAPLFYFVIVFYLVRDNVLFRTVHSWKEILLSVSFGFNFVPGEHMGFVWASWTLGVEMVFYLFFPVFFRYFNNWWKSAVFFLLTIFVAAGYAYMIAHLPIDDSHRSSFIQFSFLCQLPIFALGMVAFFVFERFIQGKSRSKVSGLALVGISILWYSAMVGVDPFGFYDLVPGRFKHFLYGYYTQAMIYSVLLLGLLILPLGLFVNRLTRFYGEISYSVYLNHPTLVFVLAPAYSSVYALGLHPTLQYGACLLLTLAPLTVISYCTYRFIERPGMAMGKRLIKSVRQKLVVS